MYNRTAVVFYRKKKCGSKRLEGYITRKRTDFVRVLDFFFLQFFYNVVILIL